jgi:hypothetical protein
MQERLLVRLQRIAYALAFLALLICFCRSAAGIKADAWDCILFGIALATGIYWLHAHSDAADKDWEDWGKEESQK